MAEPTPLRLFVSPSSCAGNRLVLGADDAARAWQRGARAGDTIVVLDNSGWELTAVVEWATPVGGEGRVVHRRLAVERRTKVSLYQGLLHPSDFRRLLARATELGVVSFTPVIADASLVPPTGDLTGTPDDEAAWASLLRDAAETAGRGRCPTIGPPMLLDHALDHATRGGLVLLVDPAGDRLASALADRPFSIEVFSPSPGGFSADERTRAEARGLRLVAPPASRADPIAAGLAVIGAIYGLLEQD